MGGSINNTYKTLIFIVRSVVYLRRLSFQQICSHICVEENSSLFKLDFVLLTSRWQYIFNLTEGVCY